MDAQHSWVATNAQFDDDKLLATLNATQGTWKDIADNYVIDYGWFIADHDMRGWFDVDHRWRLRRGSLLDLPEGYL